MRPEAPRQDALLLEMVSISKSFPGVQALKQVNLKLESGQVLALVGENGAGKSTLIKTLGGVHTPDSGEIRIFGKPVVLNTPSASHALGVGIIYQEFNLVPQLTVWENIQLGHERSWGFVNKRREREATRSLLKRLDVEIPIDRPVGTLSVAQNQLVEIAKALAYQAQILVMDEPTAALTHQESLRLFEIIRELREQQIGIIYISHRLDEVMELADRIAILRDGECVANDSADEFDRDRLIELMVGRSIENEFPQRVQLCDTKSSSRNEIEQDQAVSKSATQSIASANDITLRVKGLGRGTEVNDVSFELKAGEVLGITGLVGAGRTELVRLLFGADRYDRGSLEMEGKSISIRNPGDAIRAGICLLTEDRKHQGLILDQSVRLNFGLPNLDHFSFLGWLSRRSETEALTRYANRLRLRTNSFERPASNLSGGNQQKVVLAKWLEQNSRIIIFDEPTRGIDVGAKYEIYQLINDLAAQGKSIILVSSELPEVLGMSDRVLVMRGGKITGEVNDVKTTTPEQVLDLAVG